MYTSSGLAYYRHGDWLGSSRLASTPSQTMYSDTAYAPFGESYAPAGTIDKSFTGQNQDTASGVYDFPARELGEVSGRWPSPDPLGLGSVNPGDPQTWNRYAYVRNSPLNFTDPIGLGECEGACLDGGGGGGGYCSPEYAYCGDPCTDFGVYCIGGDYGGDDGGAGSPGLPPAAQPSFPLDTTNALNEVNGLPAGMQLPQLSAWCLVSPSCSGPSPIIQNYTDANGNLIGDYGGESIWAMINDVWTELFWNSVTHKWENQMAPYDAYFLNQTQYDRQLNELSLHISVDTTPQPCDASGLGHELLDYGPGFPGDKQVGWGLKAWDAFWDCGP